VKRRKVRKLFNVAKMSEEWTEFKRTLTEYNKALRQAKIESWRRHCDEIEKAPECARIVHRILSKNEQSSIGSIQLENGDHTITEKETLEELFRVHLPGSEIILQPSGGWDGLELEFPKWKGSSGTGQCPVGLLATISWNGLLSHFNHTNPQARME
jgi:hypothetical protein